MRVFIIIMIVGAIAYAPVYWAAAPALRRYIGIPFVISFVTLIFAGHFAPPNLFFFLLCPLVMVVLTVSRLDAICRFVLLGALIPNPSWPLVVGGVYLIQASTIDMLGVGLALAMIKPDRAHIAKVRGFATEDLVVILFFAVLSIASIRLALGFNGLMRQALSGVLQLLLPYFLLRRHIRSLAEIRIVMGCIAAACAILSIFATYEAFNGWSVFGAFNEHLGEAGVGLRNLLIRGGTMRASTAMSGPLMLGCYLSIGWIAILCSRDLLRSKRVWMAGCALIFLGGLLAQSRGSLFCVALAIPVLLAANRRVGLAVGIGSIVAIGGAGLYLSARFSSRIAGFLNISSNRVAGQDYDYRQILFRRGMEEAAKHRWLGTNIDSVTMQLNDIRQGDGIVDFVNTYLYMYLVGGLIFLFLIAVAILVANGKLIGLRTKQASRELILVRAFAMAAWISMLIALSFMSFIDRMPVLFIVVLVASRTCVQLGKSSNMSARPNSASPSGRAGRQSRVLAQSMPLRSKNA